MKLSLYSHLQQCQSKSQTTQFVISPQIWLKVLEYRFVIKADPEEAARESYQFNLLPSGYSQVI